MTCLLFGFPAHRGPLFVWLDADAGDAAVEVARSIRDSRSAAGAAAPVVIAVNPPGREDPAECNTDEVKAVIAEALATPA